MVDAYKHEFECMDLRGHSASMLEDEEDLVALKPAPDGDKLSNVVREYWPFPMKVSVV